MGRKVTEPRGAVLWVPNTQRCWDIGGTLCELLEACCPALHLQEVTAVDDQVVLGGALFRMVSIGGWEHRVLDNRGFGGRHARELWGRRARELWGRHARELWGRRARELWGRRPGFGCLNVLLSDSCYGHL